MPSHAHQSIGYCNHLQSTFVEVERLVERATLLSSKNPKNRISVWVWLATISDWNCRLGELSKSSSLLCCLDMACRLYSSKTQLHRAPGGNRFMGWKSGFQNSELACVGYKSKSPLQLAEPTWEDLSVLTEAWSKNWSRLQALDDHCQGGWLPCTPKESDLFP